MAILAMLGHGQDARGTSVHFVLRVSNLFFLRLAD